MGIVGAESMENSSLKYFANITYVYVLEHCIHMYIHVLENCIHMMCTCTLKYTCSVGRDTFLHHI